MGFLELSVMGGGGGQINFVAVTPIIITFVTGVKLDLFYTMATEKFVTSLLLRNYDVITTHRAKFQMLVTPKPND